MTQFSKMLCFLALFSSIDLVAATSVNSN
jgi:hypothetical protein